MEFHSRLQADKNASTHAIWIPGTVTKPLWHAAPRYQWRGVWKTMCSPLFITTYWHILLLMILVMHLDCAEPISIGCIPLSLSDSLHLYICSPFLNAPNLETNLHSLQQVQQLTSEWQHQRPWKFQVWISPVRKGSNYVCSLTWIAKWSIIKWWWWWWRLISRTRGSILLGWLNIIKLFEPFSERGYTTEKGSITPAWADGEAHNPCFFSSERVASPTNTRLNQVGAKSKKLCRTIKTDGEQSNQLLCHLDCFAPVCCQS